MRCSAERTETPFYQRTLDSFADDIITEVRQGGRGLWYAAADFRANPRTHSDFANAGSTREEAVARCAAAMRQSARGENPKGYRCGELEGYMLHWHHMALWAQKEQARTEERS